jgi:hypothetical protein
VITSYPSHYTIVPLPPNRNKLHLTILKIMSPITLPPPKEILSSILVKDTIELSIFHGITPKGHLLLIRALN